MSYDRNKYASTADRSYTIKVNPEKPTKPFIGPEHIEDDPSTLLNFLAFVLIFAVCGAVGYIVCS